VSLLPCLRHAVQVRLLWLTTLSVRPLPLSHVLHPAVCSWHNLPGMKFMGFTFEGNACTDRRRVEASLPS
jgi:hypothetical protein